MFPLRTPWDNLIAMMKSYRQDGIQVCCWVLGPVKSNHSFWCTCDIKNCVSSKAHRTHVPISTNCSIKSSSGIVLGLIASSVDAPDFSPLWAWGWGAPKLRRTGEICTSWQSLHTLWGITMKKKGRASYDCGYCAAENSPIEGVLRPANYPQGRQQLQFADLCMWVHSVAILWWGLPFLSDHQQLLIKQS